MWFHQRLKARKAKCDLENESFEPGMDYFSALLGENDRVDRKDFCKICWEKVNKEKFWGSWRGLVEEKKLDRPISKDDRAKDALRELIEKKDRDSHALASLLADYLKRLNQFKIKRNKDFEGTIYEDIETSEVYLIKSIEIDEKNLSTYKEKILAIIEDSSTN